MCCGAYIMWLHYLTLTFDFGPFDTLFFWPVITLLCVSDCTNPLCFITGLKCFSPPPPSLLVSTRMMVMGYKRPLEEKDLWSLNPEDCSERVVPQLVGRWNTECQKVKRSGAQHSTAGNYYCKKFIEIFNIVTMVKLCLLEPLDFM